MKSILLIFVTLFSFKVSADFSKGVNFQLVSSLETTDPYEAIAFQDGKLWVGRNRKGGEIFYQLEAFSSEGKLLATQKLKHTLGFTYPLDSQKVITVGKSWSDGSGWGTHFTISQFQNNKVISSTTNLPLAVQTERFTGDSKNLFFNEVGERGIFKFNGQVKFLAPQISGPGQMALVGESLFVIERNSIYPGDENFVKINLKNQKAERVFEEKRDHLSHFIVLNDKKMIALSESKANLVHLIDVASNKVVKSIAVEGTPSPLAQLGKCLAIVSYTDKKLNFYHLNESKFVATWDLSLAGEDYKDFRNMVVDSKVGKFFIRANYRPEHPGALTGVLSYEQPSRETLQICSK